MDLKQLGSIAGGAGAVLLVGGGVAYLIQPALRVWLLAALLVGALLVLLAAYAHLGAIARRLARRQTKYGLNVLAMIVLLLLVIALVEYFSFSYPLFRRDFTEGKRYTLSAQTVKVLTDLKKPVKAVAFYAPGTGDVRRGEDLLRQYAGLSPRFRYEFVDPDRDPGMARRYKITVYGTVVLETPEDAAPAPAGARPSGQATKAASGGEPAGAKAAEKKPAPGLPVAEQAMREEQITDLTEERLTNTLIKITRPGRRAIYFLQGHGEGNLTDAGRAGFGFLRQEVEKSNYVVKELFLPREKAVPEDAAAVAILGPQKDLAPEELAILDAHIGRGGKLLVMVDPTNAPGLKPFLAKYGLLLGDDLVMDRQFPLGGNQATPAVDRYPDHPITRDLRGIATVFSLVRSVSPAEKPPEGVTLQKLVESSTTPGSWAQPATRRTIAYQEGTDRKGPVPLAAVATIAKKTAATEPAGSGEAKKGAPAVAGPARRDDAEQRRDARARLVVYGNSRFASNTLLGLGGNRDLVMNTLSWLVEEEDLLAIRPKDPKTAPLFLTASQGRLLWLVPALVPLAVAGVGVGVFVTRRRAK